VPVTTIQGIHGAVAIVLLCSLAFVEEAGVPLPMLPGDLILIGAGVLMASHAADWRVFVPALLVATAAGAIVAFVWTRAVGARGLEALARRLRAGDLLVRTSARLRGTGAKGIFVCRIVPGLRVNASLVAGASGMEMRTFVSGLIPAVVVWGGGFIAAGALVGVPAERLLGRAQGVALNAVVLLLLGAVAYVAFRRIPGERGSHPLLAAGARWRVVAAIAIDLVVIANLALGATELLIEASGLGGPDGIIDLELIVVIVAVAYVAATRLGVGGTAGERLLAVRYTHHRRGAADAE
jgi:membrane protein DedA with SNARE-associated domain